MYGADLQKESKVLILPFKTPPEKDFDYLKTGFRAMLSGRLASRAAVQPISLNEQAEKQMTDMLQKGEYAEVLQQFNQSEADYLIVGILDRKEEMFTLECVVFSSLPGKLPASFYQSFSSIENGMIAIDELSWNISGGVFGKTRPVVAGNKIDESDDVSAFHTSHPERSYKEGIFTPQQPPPKK